MADIPDLDHMKQRFKGDENMTNINVNVDLVIDDLVKQITKLSQEKAVMSALATQTELENQKLQKQIEELKNRKSPAE